MREELAKELGVSLKYLNNRSQVLNYTNEDMNLKLDNDEQVYIAVFDIPIESGIVGFQTQSLALVFVLNTHLYHGSGSLVTDLERRPEVMKAMQSVLISCHQAVEYLERVEDYSFYNSSNVRVYLKTQKGVFFRELGKNNGRVDNFLTSMMNYVMKSISESGGIEGNIR